jgi:AcrR family transcriptional regulator
MARKTGSNGEETARQIRDAAVRLFARYGYAAVSMRDIAAAIGLQAGALYNHFPNKQALLFQAMAEHMRDLVAAWERESYRFSEPRGAMAGFVRFHLRFHAGKADHVALAYHELKSLEPANYATIENLRRLYEGHLRKILTIGKDKENFVVADIPVAAMAILAMLTGASAWYRADGRLSLQRLSEIYTGMVLRCLGDLPAKEKLVDAPATILETA